VFDAQKLVSDEKALARQLRKIKRGHTATLEEKAATARDIVGGTAPASIIVGNAEEKQVRESAVSTMRGRFKDTIIRRRKFSKDFEGNIITGLQPLTRVDVFIELTAEENKKFEEVKSCAASQMYVCSRKISGIAHAAHSTDRNFQTRPNFRLE
jgi:hypothetical protein